MALKKYKPTTPSQRQLVLVDRAGLHKGAPIKALTEGKSKSGGRNNNGRTTIRFRGGGHKQAYRVIDFKRRKFEQPARSSGSNTIPTAPPSSRWSNTTTASWPISWRRSAWPSATRSFPASMST
jgi:large subunit ribosomal protein L2